MREQQEVQRDELIRLEEELELINRIRQSPNDCEAAKERLTYANRRFVRAIAKRHVSKSHPIEKLIEEGNKVLLYAVNRYDETRGYKFISYATYWIKKSINQFINNKNTEVVPRIYLFPYRKL